jgi:AsmA protein
MRRRAAFVVPLGVLALFAAVAPWTLSSDRLRSAVSAQLKDAYGLELSVRGRSVIAFLPVPRVKFEDITLAASDGRPVARGGLLRAELRVLPLLLARFEFAEVLLKDTAIAVDIDEAGRTAWDAAVSKARERFAGRGAHAHVGRMVLTGTDLNIRDRRTGFETVLRGINLAGNWPTPESPLNVAGSLTWRGEPIELAASFLPGALAASRPGRANVQLNAPLARLVVNSDAGWSDGPRQIGRTSFETRSLRDFSRWSGLDLPLAPLIQAFALDGEVTVEGPTVSWPSARLSLGGDRLEGALSLRLEGDRRAIAGTLAADRLDLTGFAAPFLQMRSSFGGASADGIDMQRQSGTDLDLRISASAARLGAVRMEDLAANVSIKSGRYEASVARVSINKGTVKGRASLASAGDGIEIRGQSSFEGLDLASLLTDVGLSRWITGLAQGQFTFEGSGDNRAEIARRLQGRANLTVRQGELVGLGLNDFLRRKDGMPPLTLVGRGSRTPFDEAHLTLTMTDGTFEIGDGGLIAAGLRAGLTGYVSVPDHMVSVRATVEGSRLSSAIGIDITGPWENIAIAPRVERSHGDVESTGSAAVAQ